MRFSMRPLNAALNPASKMSAKLRTLHFRAILGPDCTSHCTNAIHAAILIRINQTMNILRLQ